ncbi:polyhydroxyalkanoate depolymerase [Govanella unica]|uniref:Polyhydroxyalkanoate depolymerase n=1 Tax=Govanella unica TaxID=2975056 RepID=A0A9X3Z7P8_9PROT|nr:polyhydroxyalkanoate depolymerase [Govania unica]MDA5194283.1 polyhydroxyalkanoate depolymerase [Govania unica]
MLYHLYELQHSAVAPVRIAADMSQRWLSNPFNPMSYTAGAKAMVAGLDIFEQVTRRYGKPKFGFDTVTIGDKDVAISEEIVVQKTFGQLKHFKREAEGLNDPKLLIVAPLSGHYATLLRGTVREMLPDHEVYITDWHDARNIPLWQGTFDLDDYINYIIEFIEFLGPNTHVMGVCQPAVPVIAATALMAADNNPNIPASVTLMGGPIDTRSNPTEVNKFAVSHHLDWYVQNVITRVPAPNAGCMREVYPGFLQLAGFMAMNFDRHMDAHYGMFQHLVEGDEESADASRRFYEEYRSVMDMPAEFYLQTIRQVFLEYHIPLGIMTSRGRKVDLGAITKTALLTVEGELDDISGAGQTRAALDLCVNLPASKKEHYEQLQVGHYGIFNGGKWRKFIAPHVKAFIRAHPTV